MQGTINSFKQNSQNFKILEYLKTGASLTCLQAAQMGFGMNLRSRISDLKRAGYDIKSEMIPIKDSYVAEYSLELMDEKDGDIYVPDVPDDEIFNPYNHSGF